MSHEEKHSQNSGDVEVLEKTKIQKPPKYKVFLHNDDFTPMDFVVHILQQHFAKNLEDATCIMLLVHNKGIALCGIYPKDIAEIKVHTVNQYSIQNEHPLHCSMEPE
jgi:ATP-dependent Clp protease adaptor protein ClpS